MKLAKINKNKLQVKLMTIHFSILLPAKKKKKKIRGSMLKHKCACIYIK